MRPRRGPERPRRWLPVLVITCLLAAGVTTATVQAAPPIAASASTPSADAALEGQFVSSINSLRASKGLRQLQVSGQLQSVARAWTDRMVGAGNISHNPSIGSQVGGGWTKLGENVGVGHDVAGLMQAFINSPAHYANLVDPAWTQLGVGVTRAADGRIYTTHNFMAGGGGGAPPPPPAPTATTAPPPPPPPSTTTTAPPPPPTTTTTAPPPPPAPEPTPDRVTAVLDPLRSLEAA